MPIPASTELKLFLYISCCKKLPHFLSVPPLLAPGGMYPSLPLPTATEYKVGTYKSWTDNSLPFTPKELYEQYAWVARQTGVELFFRINSNV